VSGSIFLLESTNNCAAEQYVYFYASPAKDMSDFANGRVTFKIEADNTGQQITFVVQDDYAQSSSVLDISNYGFDANKAGIFQAISIPVSQLTTQGIDLKKMDKLFQIFVVNSANDSFTYIADVYWMLE